MSALIVEQTVQSWGNSLAVRLNAKVAKAAHIAEGQPVLVEVVEGGVLLRPVRTPRETWPKSSHALTPRFTLARSCLVGCVARNASDGHAHGPSRLGARAG